MKCSECGHEHDTNLDYCPYCENNTHPPNISMPEQTVNKEKLNFFFQYLLLYFHRLAQ